MAALLAVAGALCFGGVGYLVRGLVDRYRAAQRERVLRSLGGALPDWEVMARALEERAQQCVATMTQIDMARRCARGLRDEADITRRRGRARDRLWL
jgi:hypothetical protein